MNYYIIFLYNNDTLMDNLDFLLIPLESWEQIFIYCDITDINNFCKSELTKDYLNNMLISKQFWVRYLLGSGIPKVYLEIFEIMKTDAKLIKNPKYRPVTNPKYIYNHQAWVIKSIYYRIHDGFKKMVNYCNKYPILECIQVYVHGYDDNFDIKNFDIEKLIRATLSDFLVSRDMCIWESNKEKSPELCFYITNGIVYYCISKGADRINSTITMDEFTLFNIKYNFLFYI